jgi:hypothetical protein
MFVIRLCDYWINCDFPLLPHQVDSGQKWKPDATVIFRTIVDDVPMCSVMLCLIPTVT